MPKLLMPLVSVTPSFTPGSSVYGPASASVAGPITAAGVVTGLSHVAASSTYGATSAIVNGPLTCAGGTFSGPAFTIVPASTSGYTFRNAANTTSPMIVSNTGALTILGVGTQPGSIFWTNPSDERIKGNIAPHTEGLAQILALRPIAYEYNGLGGTVVDGRRHVGLSAQHTMTVAPSTVSSTRAKLDPNDAHEIDLLSIDASPIFFSMINAIRDLSDQIEALRTLPPPKQRGFFARMFSF